MCPIAIDVVEKFQIISEPEVAETEFAEPTEAEALEAPLHPTKEYHVEEDLLPQIEQHEEIYEDADFSDHVIPVKGEHHDIIDDEY